MEYNLPQTKIVITFIRSHRQLTRQEVKSLNLKLFIEYFGLLPTDVGSY